MMKLQGTALKVAMAAGGLAVAYVVYRVATTDSRTAAKDGVSGLIGALWGTVEGLFGGVRDTVGQGIADTVTSPALDWLYSASNPLSDDAEEEYFLELVNDVLRQRGASGLTTQEAILARGYAPVVGMFGTAAKYKDSYFLTANPHVCAGEAATEIQRRRGR